MVITVRVAAALVLAGLLLPASAAAFAGRNGDLVYEGRASAHGRLTVRDPAGGAPHVLTTSGRPTSPAVSAAGMRIAYAQGGHIWVMQADGSNQRQLTSGFFDGDPSWSPLGDQLVFTSGRAGGRDLFTIGLDGNGLRRLTAMDADELSPTWSARNEIAFVRESPAGDGDLWRTGPQGGPQRLTGGPADDREPAWSPDGRRIAFVRGIGGRRDIYVASRLGHHVHRLQALPFPPSGPVFSPDGRWIAFAMGKRPGRRAIWAMRANGKGLHRIANGSAGARSLDWRPRPGDPVVAAAGDIACDPTMPNANDSFGAANSCHERGTSDLLLRMDLTAVLMLGDAQYEDGAFDKFTAEYDPTWGRLRGLTHPAIGNHEYLVDGIAGGYFDYFNGPGQATGPAGNRGEGWYSFDLGSWHIISLNSNCDRVSCDPGGPQFAWLQADLAAHRTTCTLALMHHPLVSSGMSEEMEGTTPGVAPLWQALYDAGADVVMSGHDHAYEHFAPLNPQAQVDPARGMRLFVAGTGGKFLQRPHSSRVGSEARQGSWFGVTRLTLHPASYDWQFVPESAGGFTDAGTGACH